MEGFVFNNNDIKIKALHPRPTLIVPAQEESSSEDEDKDTEQEIRERKRVYARRKLQSHASGIVTDDMPPLVRDNK